LPRWKNVQPEKSFPLKSGVFFFGVIGFGFSASSAATHAAAPMNTTSAASIRRFIFSLLLLSECPTA